MKCPLRSVGTHEADEICGIQSFDCIQQECAWFYVTGECCAILTLAWASASRLKILKSLESKTPLGGVK